MSPPLRNTSSNLPNLPQDFNLANDPVATYARPNTLTAALTQRSMFLTQTITTDDNNNNNNNNTTQPFAINDDISNNNLNEHHQNTQQQQRPTTANKTASYKRRKHRNYQQQYRNMADNNNSDYNKFSELSDQDACTDIDSNYEYAMNDDTQLMNNNNNANNMNMNKQETKQNRNSKKKKQRLYLEPNQIMLYMQANAATIINSRGNQAYILATSTIYDEWVRNNYDLQVWQNYLKLGTDDKHWAKEVVKGTKDGMI
ncbi:unnamed protein product [Rotaria magnacalcarata]|uniref:Uncharacterized protein n=1 Tax=Rotaria magnacalcarata TaxID=392030 RepID=A0A816Y2K7_9BILA|nr:unnamed protein product [Rotaria magnacalcarata]CAF1570803.1 unnamed protein product [Rotaria magnacalcarata]CAF1969970.1 unnamed protein product [Rotaria magnacalcarata]CAF2153833.1 unnamed protein product [Rotaria magnacalcarata]